MIDTIAYRIGWPHSGGPPGTALPGDQAVVRALRTSPDAPSGPRPTFAISTLEQMRAAQKVPATMDIVRPDAAPDILRTLPASATFVCFV